MVKCDRNSLTSNENAIALCLVGEGDRIFGLTKARVQDTLIRKADTSTPTLAVASRFLAH